MSLPEGLLVLCLKQEVKTRLHEMNRGRHATSEYIRRGDDSGMICYQHFHFVFCESAHSVVRLFLLLVPPRSHFVLEDDSIRKNR